MTAQPKSAPEVDALDAIDEPAPLGYDEPPPTIDELIAVEDSAGLVELGAAHRAGAPFVEKDAFKALECFEAASRLGDADAEYLVGLAYFNGAGIGRDVPEGAKRLRSAAQRGSLRAKVFVANLYEMGVHYAHDAEKADVWYRNVARAAGIDADPGSEAYTLEMAELGCVRQCLALVADEALPKKDRAFYLKRAKSMGYGHRLAQAKGAGASPGAADAAGEGGAASEATGATSRSAATATATASAAAAGDEAPSTPGTASALAAEAGAASSTAETSGASEAAPSDTDASGEKKTASRANDEADEEPVLLGAQWTFVHGLLAFVAAAFFAAAASGAGWLAMEGSRALAAAGRPLPGVGPNHWAVLAVTLLALAVLPATATYRAKVVASGALVGAASAAGAYYLWDVTHLLWDRVVQAAAGGLAGFLVVLLFLGLLGGTRMRGEKQKKAAGRP